MDLIVTTRRQVLAQDEGGHACWQVVERSEMLPAARTALLICDVWDRHWSRGTAERVEAMVPRMNRVATALRAQGVRIIHAPSDTLAFYEGTPARRRMQELPRVPPPSPRDLPDPPLPVDASDQGSDTGETEPYQAWTRQHPGLEIDHDRDGISDQGEEIYSFLAGQGIDTLLFMGVHTNMCVLGRSFGIKQMVRWGVRTLLIRDLTDAMYNPARPPYVSHAEGTRLVVEYIEKFWALTIHSAELLGGARDVGAGDR